MKTMNAEELLGEIVRLEREVSKCGCGGSCRPCRTGALQDRDRYHAELHDRGWSDDEIEARLYATGKEQG
jgi:hypothetical protein